MSGARSGYMGDTTRFIGSELELPIFADNLHNAGLLTNLFSLGPKQLLVVAAYEGFQVTFHPRSVYTGGSHMPLHQGPGCVRVAGRHRFPHIYYKVDKMNLFGASWRASRVLAMVRLPSYNPYQMCGVVARGQQR